MSEAESGLEGNEVLVISDIVAWVEVDGEIVAIEPEHEEVHHLDPAASLLWRALDSEVTLDELAADVADVFNIRFEQARADVLTFANRLLDAGLASVVGT